MAAPSSHMWYVKTAGGVWGPYPEARLHAFVAEGRVTADTPVSPWAAGPFAAASASAEFAELISRARHDAADAAKPATAQPATPGRVATQTPSSTPPQMTDGGPVRAVLVWARVSEASTERFNTELAALGHGVTLHPGLWLVQARAGASVLRNRLSRTLGASDTLLVVEAPLEQAAWFNLDPARDREVRRLWAASGAA